MAGEHLRILHQGEVQFTKLVWLPDLVNQNITLQRTSTEGSLTHQLSKENIQQGLSAGTGWDDILAKLHRTPENLLQSVHWEV